MLSHVMVFREVRTIWVVALLVAGLAAGAFTWAAQQRLRDSIASSQSVGDATARMTTTLALLEEAQRVYSETGRFEAGQLQHLTALVPTLALDVDTLAAALHAPDAMAALAAARPPLEALEQTAARARDNAGAGQDLMASDLLLAGTRDDVAALADHLRVIRSAERTAGEEARAWLLRVPSLALAGVATLWFVSLLVITRPAKRGLAPRPELTSRPPASAAHSAHLSATAEAQAPALAAADARDALQAPSTPASAADSTGARAADGDRATEGAPDFGAATDVGLAISRLTTADDLAPLMARAGRALGASGLVLWMRVDDELLPALVSGQVDSGPTGLSRVRRGEDGAVAQAWRTGAVTTVDGGSATGRAGLAVPMFSGDRCAGVLCVELERGRQARPDIAAVSTMLAALLASTVAAWPAESSVPTGGEPALDMDAPAVPGEDSSQARISAGG
ncbi:MAG: GAF domain-containing protein [Vicinamibacterales bacterium]